MNTFHPPNQAGQALAEAPLALRSMSGGIFIIEALTDLR
jgi:hypothetical protein